MKIEDFAKVQRAQTGNRRILKYHVDKPGLLKKYFKQCYNKPAILAEKLGMHYQSCRKLLQENGLWKYVRTKNGKGAGFNRYRKNPTSLNGYLYSSDVHAYKIDGNRSRRKLMHIDVMEKHLKRELRPGEVVHHLDLNKTNNKINNLLLCCRAEHTFLHSQLNELVKPLLESGQIIFDRKTRRYKLRNIKGKTNAQ